jgi:hypothetical protein
VLREKFSYKRKYCFIIVLNMFVLCPRFCGYKYRKYFEKYLCKLAVFCKKCQFSISFGRQGEMYFLFEIEKNNK